MRDRPMPWAPALCASLAKLWATLWAKRLSPRSSPHISPRWPWMLGLAIGSTAQAAPCGQHLPAAGRQIITGPQGQQLAFAPRPAPVPVGRHFALDIVLCPPPGQAMPETLKLDAQMPAHRHGMNYQPTVKALGQGRFVAEGLMFHMPGLWRWTFELQGPGDTPAQRLQADTTL